ncbi:MAG: CPBP family intramembrane metalloprotease [Clostridia bacterium]|nr:CPBP family intramembrane metalloprotease [Clostridia bacterium]
MKPRPLFLSLLLFAQLAVSLTVGGLGGELWRRLGMALSLLLPLVFFLRAPEGTRRPSLLPKSKKGYRALYLLPLFVLITAGVSIAWGALCAWLGIPIRGAEPYGVFGLSLLLDALLPAVCEEIFCRGALFAVLRPMGRRTAVYGSALLFAMMHASVAQIPYAFAAGLLLALLMEGTGALLLPILFHLANNLTSLLLLFGASVPWVYGILGVLAALGLFLLLRTAKREAWALPAAEESERGALRELVLSPLSAYLAVMLIFTVL